MTDNSTNVSEPAREALVDGDFPLWIAEAFGASGLGVAGVALFVQFMGALGLFNWSESFKVPAIWLTLTTPTIAAVLPVPVVWRIMGIVTTAVAFLFIGLWLYWART